jgi:hypothetical protein
VAIEPTTFIVLAVFALTFLGVAYGLKTRKGSGINEHPGPGSGDPQRNPTLDELDPTLDESGELPDAEPEESTMFDQRGTK